MSDCEYQECDCDECCPPLDDARGFQGQSGPNGLDVVGPQGFVGPEYTAPPGPRGPQGPLCCTTESLRGPQGDQGPQGQNQDGFQGPMGPQGATTPSLEGAQGLLGMQGAQGRSDVGMQGFQGSSTRGVQGPQGYQGFVGSSPIGVMGAQGVISFLNSFVSIPSIPLPLSFSGTLASVMPPGPGKFICTICFSMVINDAFTAPENVIFTVIQNSTTLASFDYIIDNGAGVFNTNTYGQLLAFDVFSSDTTGTQPFEVHYFFSNVSPRQWLVYNFVATLAQI